MRLPFAGPAVLLLGCCLVSERPVVDSADPPRKPALPDADYPRLIEPSVTLIRTALAGKPNRRAADKARVAALMLAEFAQQNLQGDSGAQRATIRDAALAIAGLIRGKQYAEALKQAQGLASIAANDQAKKERVKIVGPHCDVEALMSQFRATKLGGLGIEALLDQLAVEKNNQVSAALLTDDLRLLAYRTAVAGGMLDDHVPPMKAQAWTAFADRMRQSAGALGEAVAAKDGKAAYAAVGRLNASCNDCHKMFRQ